MCDKYRVMDEQFAQQAHRDYVENQVFSAHPAERVYMLYQVAIDSVNTAIARLKDGDIFARGRAVNKAHEAVDELILALDHSVGANFTHTLAELYDYVQRQLVKGHSPKVGGSVSPMPSPYSQRSPMPGRKWWSGPAEQRFLCDAGEPHASQARRRRGL